MTPVARDVDGPNDPAWVDLHRIIRGLTEMNANGAHVSAVIALMVADGGHDYPTVCETIVTAMRRGDVYEPSRNRLKVV